METSVAHFRNSSRQSFIWGSGGTIWWPAYTNYRKINVIVSIDTANVRNKISIDLCAPHTHAHRHESAHTEAYYSNAAAVAAATRRLFEMNGEKNVFMRAHFLEFCS